MNRVDSSPQPWKLELLAKDLARRRSELSPEAVMTEAGTELSCGRYGAYFSVNLGFALGMISFLFMPI